MNDTRSILAWLADGARSAAGPDQVLAQLCDGLLAAGIPLARVSVFVQTLHPDIMGRAFRWRPGVPVTIASAGFALLDSPAYIENPTGYITRTGEAVRRRLCDPACPRDFPILAELLADKMTDYFAAPLIFTNGEINVATFATQQPDGFSEAEFESLKAVVAPLARVAEVRALRRTATNLLNTYVGRQAGERILAGRIQRGHTETINAALWLSDLRGFTTLTDKLPPQELIELLNRYFDCQVPAIEAHGGEVLKFMGDGLLAIFPIGPERPPDTVCANTLAAVRETVKAVEALRTLAVSPADRDLRFAISLHVGDVLYGNVGGRERLDFTCIGPAVNLAARMEKVARDLGRTVIASAEFAGHCGDDFVPLGEFSLRGFDAARAVYGLRDETPLPSA